MSNSHLDDELECIIEQLRAENATKGMEIDVLRKQVDLLRKGRPLPDAEIVELKAMVNELRGGVIKGIGWLTDVNNTICDELQEVLYKTPTQSLHYHDKALAEKVRGFIEKELVLHDEYDAAVTIRNLDLTAIVRGESEEVPDDTN